MKKEAFVILHAFIILLFIIFMVITAKALTSYYNNPFSLSLLDSGLWCGSFLGLTYFSYWLFIPQFIVKREYIRFVLGFLVIILGFNLCFNMAALFISSFFKLKMYLFVPGSFESTAGYALTMGMAGTFFRLFIEWLRDAQHKVQLEKQNFKSELALLRNQLNPHFLFNTLNNIDSLIIEKSPYASLALTKLSDIMRYVVYDSEREFVPLGDELKYVQNFISLQKLRIPNEKMIHFEVTGQTENLRIAPMLLIPFVENAFKHSSLKDDPKNTIEIKVNAAPGRLFFDCFNHRGLINKDSSSGVGLANVKKRLELIYGDRHHLNIHESEESFSVHLEIKI